MNSQEQICPKCSGKGSVNRFVLQETQGWGTAMQTRVTIHKMRCSMCAGLGRVREEKGEKAWSKNP